MSVFGVVLRIGTAQSFVFYVVTAYVIVAAWSGFQVLEGCTTTVFVVETSGVQVCVWQVFCLSHSN